MNIRKIANSEIAFLSDMLYEAIFVPKGQEPFPKSIVEDQLLFRYIEHWGKDICDLALVAEMDGELVGAVWGRLFSEHNKGFGYVDSITPELSIAVKPAHRNKGIGSALLAAIAKAYKPMGMRQLSLSVDKANAALRLYQRLGFELVEEVDSSLILKKVLC